MAKNRAKPPISSHGLFPVVVAVWFAALFGLGSLVLPNVLLERLTTGSGIAALVPAAAPPLGVTARIAISSSAAVFGALLGFFIARRVAEAQANTRSASLDRQIRFAEDRQANAKDSARRPISAKEELGNARVDAPAEPRNAAPPQPPIPGRRRALTMNEEQGPSEFLQAAPPPGDDTHWADNHPLMPSAMAIAEKAIAQHARNAQQQAQQAARAPEPLDLQEFSGSAPADFGGMASLRNRQFEAAAGIQQDEEAESPAPQAHPAFASPETSYAEIAGAPQVSAPDAPTEFVPTARSAEPGTRPFAPPAEPAPQQFAPPAEAARQDFSAPEQVAEPPAAPFAQPATPDDSGEVALPFSKPAAQVQPAVADTQIPADPLAGLRNSSFEEDDAKAELAMPFAAPSPEAASLSDGDAAFAASDQHKDEPLPFVAPSQVRQATAAPAAQAPQWLASPSHSVAEPLRALLAGDSEPASRVDRPLEQLGMVELAERLGRSVHKRLEEQARAAAIVPAAETPAPVQFETEPEPVAEAPEPAAIPRGFGELPEAPESPAVPRAFDVPAEPRAEPVEAPESELPTAEQPAAQEAPAFDVPAESSAQPSGPAIPAALRPLDLEFDEAGEDEDEHDELAASFSLPRTGMAAAPAPDFSKPADAPSNDEGGAHEEEAESEDVPAAGYSSLLTMKSPFRGPAEFVRIELPEPEAGAIEPAVVFPGQNAPRQSGAAPLPFAAPVAAKPAAADSEPEATQADEPAPAGEATPRRFDAPADAAEQVALRKAKAKADPAETERALRSALATLQRMSGAA